MGTEELKRYVRKEGTPRAIIVDIDGTVAHHYNEVGEQLRGHYEYSKVLGDLPDMAIIDLVGMLDYALYKIIFVSGREDSCREDTEEWLARYGFDKSKYKLFMRKTGDHRPDYVIKYEIFDASIRDHYDIAFALDDRTQVVQMWRSLGIKVLQVADGNF